jgi:glycosyltransferase involved in cell wall biosynthesis
MITCTLLQSKPAFSGRFDRRVGILIPAFNEAAHLGKLLRACRALKPALILVVDDASVDATPRILEAEAADRRSAVPVVGLRNRVNLGKQGSIRRGLRHLIPADLDAVVLIDGDGQHDPAELPGLVRLLSRFDFVIGARSTLEMPPQRQVSNWLVNQAMAFIAGVDFGDVQSGLRVYRKDLADLLGVRLPRAGRYALEHESLALLAEHASEEGRRLQAAAAPVSCRYRGSESRIRPLDVLQLAFETVRSALRLQAADRRPALREVIA